MTRRNPSKARQQSIAVFATAFLEDLRYWIETDRKTSLRVLELVEAALRDPFSGIGKPERLKHWDEAAWSRRVNEADRLVYIVEGGRVTFLQCRYHY